LGGLETLLVRVERRGRPRRWGDAFSYNCQRAVRAAVDDMAPSRFGSDAAISPGSCTGCRRRCHLFGRYGITIFALSGLDIALWDLARSGRESRWWSLLGGPARMEIDAYAQPLPAARPLGRAMQTREALARAIAASKLHERRNRK